MLAIVREILSNRSGRDALLFARILLFAAVLPLLLRLKLTTVRAIVEPRRGRPPADPTTVHKIQRYVDAVCSSRVIRAKCLVRSLVRYYFLRRAGLALSVIIGVADGDGGIVGHAWLVKDERPFLEPVDPAPRFTVMMTFPGERPARRP